MIRPTKNNVLLEVKEQKLAGGLVVSGDGGGYSDFFIVSVGPDVTKEYKKGAKALLRMSSVPTRTIDGKKFALVEDIDINGIEE